MASYEEIGFQSIGVTKDWRLISANPAGETKTGFQSIGVTKDWRLENEFFVKRRAPKMFPINRRHQGLATGGHWVIVGPDFQCVSNQ